MEFLVRFETHLPDSMGEDERRRLKEAERARAMRLRVEPLTIATTEASGLAPTLDLTRRATRWPRTSRPAWSGTSSRSPA